MTVDCEILGFWTQILERVLRDLIYPPHSYRHMAGLTYFSEYVRLPYVPYIRCAPSVPAPGSHCGCRALVALAS